jgi:hypothetical protein
MNSSHARLSCMTLEASRLRWSLFRRITLYNRPQIFVLCGDLVNSMLALGEPWHLGNQYLTPPSVTRTV